jgi:hypothetical protein
VGKRGVMKIGKFLDATFVKSLFKRPNIIIAGY